MTPLTGTVMSWTLPSHSATWSVCVPSEYGWAVAAPAAAGAARVATRRRGRRERTSLNVARDGWSAVGAGPGPGGCRDTSRVRILFITPTLGVGGAERLVVAESAALAARGHAVTVAFGVFDVQGAALREAGVDERMVSRRHLGTRTLPEWARAARRVVREVRPDVLYAHSVTAAIVARAAAPRLPMLVTVHGIPSESEARAARVLRLVRATVSAVSAQTAAGLRRHGLPNIEVLPPGVDLAALRAATRRPARRSSTVGRARLRGIGPPDARVEGRPRFVCVARQEPEKGVDVLVAAFAEVVAAYPEAVLALVGAGSQMAGNKADAATAGIRDRVEFMGVLSNPAPAIADADAVVLPSRREGLPVVVLEA